MEILLVLGLIALLVAVNLAIAFYRENQRLIFQLAWTKQNLRRVIVRAVEDAFADIKTISRTESGVLVGDDRSIIEASSRGIEIAVGRDKIHARGLYDDGETKEYFFHQVPILLDDIRYVLVRRQRLDARTCPFSSPRAAA